MPTREELQKYLENQKMEDIAKQYLAELRNKAIIEVRN